MTNRYEEELKIGMINKHEANNSDGEMSVSAIASYFGVPVPEVVELTEDQKENDIYRIKARIQNLLTATGGNMNQAGEILVNSYVGVLKRLYDFAETINETDRKNLRDILQSQENMPALVSGALFSRAKESKNVRRIE